MYTHTEEKSKEKEDILGKYMIPEYSNSTESYKNSFDHLRY